MIHMDYTLILVIMKLLIYGICQVACTVIKIIILIIKIKNGHRDDKHQWPFFEQHELTITADRSSFLFILYTKTSTFCQKNYIW